MNEITQKQVDQLRNLLNTPDLNKAITVNLPFFGDISVGELEGYLPYYLKMRKELREFVPLGVDSAIMDYAEKKGLVDKRPRKIEDIDRPLREIERDIEEWLEEGWSVCQTATKCGVYPHIVKVAKEKREARKKEEDSFIKRWIWRKVLNVSRRHLK